MNATTESRQQCEGMVVLCLGGMMVLWFRLVVLGFGGFMVPWFGAIVVP